MSNACKMKGERNHQQIYIILGANSILSPEFVIILINNNIYCIPTVVGNLIVYGKVVAVEILYVNNRGLEKIFNTQI